MFNFIENYKKILNYFLVFAGTLYLVYVVIIIYPEDNYPTEFLNELSYNLQYYFKEKSNNRIIKLLQSSAVNGSKEGQYNLARMYATGCFEALDKLICDKNELVTDKEKAINWYRISAEQGYAPAQNNLAIMYLEGKGTEINYKKALDLYTLAAEQGYVPAQNALNRYFPTK